MLARSLLPEFRDESRSGILGVRLQYLDNALFQYRWRPAFAPLQSGCGGRSRSRCATSLRAPIFETECGFHQRFVLGRRAGGRSRDRHSSCRRALRVLLRRGGEGSFSRANIGTNGLQLFPGRGPLHGGRVFPRPGCDHVADADLDLIEVIAVCFVVGLEPGVGGIPPDVAPQLDLRGPFVAELGFGLAGPARKSPRVLFSLMRWALSDGHLRVDLRVVHRGARSWRGTGAALSR